MKIKMVIWLLSCLAFTGCASNLNRTHRGQLLDDKVTAQRVQAALARAGNDFTDVHAVVTDGVVVLSGSVRSLDTRARAERIASAIRRVSNVEDDLQVRQ